MSVILNWESPESTFLPIARAMKVVRGPQCTVCSDNAPWGFFEDVGANDLSEQYTIFLLNSDQNEIGRVESSDIRKYIRPTNSCKVAFEFTNPDGSPNECLKIEIRHPIQQNFYRVICTNTAGRAEAVFLFGQRLLITVAGMEYTLDCVIPTEQDITFEKLVPNGSWVLSELRGTTP